MIFALNEPEEIAPLVLLESLQTPGLRFVCVPVAVLSPKYQLELTEEERSLLGGAAPDAELQTLALITFWEGGAPTANLKAPVVLNPTTRRGIQSIQTENEQSILHPLHQEFAEGGPSC